ncbi:hypothetical protein Leryth_015700 [Lithospermum erythrorhizon]|nr:hypothetical protein Leryth_015700 [Lithospermum erythrorhizon]
MVMRGGGCKEQFVEFEKCMEEGEKNNEDVVEKCYSVTTAWKVCMDAHADDIILFHGHCRPWAITGVEGWARATLP